MNIRFAFALVLASFIPLAAANPPAGADLTPSQKKVLFERAGAVGAPQRKLAMLAGDWTVDISLWADPGQPPAMAKGTATYASVLGGRQLRQELRFQTDGKPFEGIGYIGFDNVTGRYFSSWMDTSFTGTMLAHGDFDASTDTYTFLGSQPDPTSEAMATPVREVMHIADGDHFTYEYFETRHGVEAIAVRLRYTRAGQ